MCSIRDSARCCATGGYDRRSVAVATATPRPARAVSDDSVLDVENLVVGGVGPREIVHGIGFTVARGETLGIVGESGSGKSLSVLSATGLFDAPSAYVRGSSLLAVPRSSAPPPSTLRALHGTRVGFVFQDPSSSLNPLLTIEQQLAEGTTPAPRSTAPRRASVRCSCCAM